jgi:two-component system sensor histidine kinase KdpD
MHPVAEVFSVKNEAPRTGVGSEAASANHKLLVRKDGTEVFISDNSAPIKDEGGSTRGVVLVFRDITESQQTEVERERLLRAEAKARAEAERQSELRLRFLGIISHELRTPLTSIKGFATTLLAEDVAWDAASQRDFIATIDQEADKLTNMIEQLLDLSRIESGRLSVAPERVSMAELLDGVLPALTTLAAEHVLTVDVPQGLPVVRADQQRVGQVLSNLVGNAAKYSPKGTSIYLRVQPDGEGLRVSVSDEGPGIAPEDRPHVFEAFRRGSDSQARQTKGTGLGLAICKGIVEAHGGRIWFEEHDGPGTTVSFTLPVAG